MYIDTFGLDYIITKEDIVLLEINGGPAILLQKKDFKDKEEYKKQSINRGYFQALGIINIFNDNKDTIEGVTLFFEKGENDLQVNTIFKHLKENNIPVEILYDTPENSMIYKEKWIRFGKLGSAPQIGKLINDKLNTKKIIEESEFNVSTPSLNTFTYNEKSLFPNVVEKPIHASQGKGIRFHKNSKIQGKFVDQKADKKFFESYVECNPITDRLVHMGNNKFVKESLGGKYVYDIRITVATYNTKWYPFFELKRIAQLPLPKQLDEGVVNKNHYAYLTNLSQGSSIGFLEPELKDKLIPLSIDIMEYFTHNRNVGKIKNVFWTGGQSSTYRIIELLLSGYTVKPFYLCYSLDGEKGIGERVMTLNKLSNLIKHRYPQYSERLLPINFIYENEITITNELKNLWENNYKDVPFKFLPLILFSHILKEEIEICVYVENKNKLPKLKYISYPNELINKLNSYTLCLNKNCEEIIDNTWSCDSPKLGEECGVCQKCEDRQIKLKNSGLKIKFKY